MAEPRPRTQEGPKQQDPGQPDRVHRPRPDEPITPQLREQLQVSLNYTNRPGAHTLKSPVAGARSAELLRLRQIAPQNPALVSFSNAIYQPEFVHLIPARDAARAEVLSRQIFTRYLARYPGSGLNEGNAVMWTEIDLTRTYIADGENKHNTWNVQPVVYDKTHLRNGKCLPKYIAALHEIMHVEEVPRGAREDWDKPPSAARSRTLEDSTKATREGGGASAAPSMEMLSELMPTLMTIVLADEVYKSLNNIPLGREVNYGHTVQWDTHSVPLGRIANFYRSLITQYGSIGAAVASPESLEFMRQGSIPPRMVTPVRTP